MARLQAKGEAHLDEERRLLGAFRAGGLIVPVWEVAPDSDPSEHEGAVADFAGRYAAAGADHADLDARRIARAVFVRDTIRTLYNADKKFGFDPADNGSLADQREFPVYNTERTVGRQRTRWTGRGA